MINPRFPTGEPRPVFVQMKQNRMRLSVKLIIYVGLVASILVIALGTLAESLEFERVKNEREQRDRDTLYFIDAVLIDAVVADDKALIDSIINRIVEREPNIDEISVLDEQNQTLSRWSKNPSRRRCVRDQFPTLFK